MRLVKLLIFLMLLYVPYVSSYGQEKTIVAVDESNPPFMYLDETSGMAAGIYPSLITAVCGRAGLPVEIKTYPWKRALILGERGECGIGGIYKNEKRLGLFDYSDLIFSEKLVFYTRKGQSIHYKDVSSLRGKTVAVILGWSYGDSFDKGRAEGLFNVDEARSDNAGLQKLLLRREIDCVLLVEESGERTIARLGIQDRISKEPAASAELPTYLVFAKKAGNQPFIRSFNKALKKMKDDGRYQTVIRNASE